MPINRRGLCSKTESSTCYLLMLFNPRCACAARVTVLGLHVCLLSVCVCVYAYFRATDKEVDGERYQRHQCYKRLNNKMTIFL